MGGFAYLMASKKNGTLYAGMTNNPARRMYEHKEGKGKSFTARYGVHMLVWYEEFFDIRDAIAREKRIKKWPRRWKLDLINKMNPDWEDLSNHFF